MHTSLGAFARPYGSCLLGRRFLLAIVLATCIAFVAQPAAKADVIYTFFDLHGNTVLQFAAPYIVTKNTAPEQVNNFIVAPQGFLPCTLSIYNQATTANTLGCLSSTNGFELWALTSGPFPTHPGAFTVTFLDILWGASGDIPGAGGNISPEPASMLLFGTGIGAIGMWKLRRKRAKELS